MSKIVMIRNPVHLMWRLLTVTMMCTITPLTEHKLI